MSLQKFWAISSPHGAYSAVYTSTTSILCNKYVAVIHKVLFGQQISISKFALKIQTCSHMMPTRKHKESGIQVAAVTATVRDEAWEISSSAAPYFPWCLPQPRP